jgi:OOP family OmpA-OmpF porin
MNRSTIGAVSLVLMGSCSYAVAQAQDVSGYVQDVRGLVVKDPYDLCWRTGYWTPALAIAECDPDLVPKPPAPPPRPVARAVPPPEPAPAPKPAPVVAPPPPPPPVVIPKPVPVAAPAPKPCDAAATMESDELFAFGKAVLSKAAMARLDRDVLGRAGSCARVDSVVVEGHTDRIGGEKSNQQLSERRAEAVKAYLVSKGMSASSIQTLGRGETTPVVNCPDGKSRKDLIACLAPNRRVVVNIKGPGK